MVLKNLNSVGSVIDENGIVYPMLADGGYDALCGVHVNDMYFFDNREDWFDALSQQDIDIIEDIWQAIAEVERRMAIKYTKSLGTKLNYLFDLSEYWEDVYLSLIGKRIYDNFF